MAGRGGSGLRCEVRCGMWWAGVVCGGGGLMLDGRCLMSVEEREEECERANQSICLFAVLFRCLVSGAREGLPAPREGDERPSIVPGHRPGPVRVFRGRKGHNQHHASRRRLPGANAMHAHQIIQDGTHPGSLSFFFFFVAFVFSLQPQDVHCMRSSTPQDEER